MPASGVCMSVCVKIYAKVKCMRLSCSSLRGAKVYQTQWRRAYKGEGVVDSTGGSGGGVRDSLTAHFSENWVVLNFEWSLIVTKCGKMVMLDTHNTHKHTHSPTHTYTQAHCIYEYGNIIEISVTPCGLAAKIHLRQ